MILIDTDVLVDYLRGSAAAKNWLDNVRDDALAVPGIVAMELVIGCRSQRELRELESFVDALTVVWPEAHEFEHSYRLLVAHRLTSGLGIPDWLIAADLHPFFAHLVIRQFVSFTKSPFAVLSGRSSAKRKQGQGLA